MNIYERLLLHFVREGQLAPELDVDFYRLIHADLSAFGDNAARAHYANHGQDEGRIASPAGHRVGFTGQISTVGAVLEIGPAVRPVLRGSNIRYFDVASSAGLIARALQEGYPVENCPEIHFFSPDGDLSVVEGRFIDVFSSHCIEHQPDIITHLSKVSALLERGGRYFVIVPDKRYCFDALLPASTLDQVMVAHSERRRVHTWQSVYDHYVLTTHNDTPRHWAGDSADPRAHQTTERTEIARRLFSEAAGGYVDVHAWQFTSTSFHEIMSEISETMTGLRLDRVHHPLRGSNEFFAVFTKAA